MSLPYEARMVTTLLRSMSESNLAKVKASDFQRHPAPIILRGQVLDEMIANEKARRRT